MKVKTKQQQEPKVIINSKLFCKVTKDGTKYWYLNGKLHREGGPAVEYPDGTIRWYLDSIYYQSKPALFGIDQMVGALS